MEYLFYVRDGDIFELLCNHNVHYSTTQMIIELVHAQDLFK